MELSTNNTITSLVLHTHLCHKLGPHPYETFYTELVEALNWFVINKLEGFHTFSYNTYTADEHTQMDLTEPMVFAYINSIAKCTNELRLDVSYLFNGVKSVSYLQHLHQTHAPTPIIDENDYPMDSLQFVELINKGRVASGVSPLNHNNALKTIRATFLRISENPQDLTFIDCRMKECSYIDDRGKPQGKVEMSDGLALAAGMTYDANTRDAVQNEMNRLRVCVISTPCIVSPPPITVDNLTPPQPVATHTTFISQAKAEEVTGIAMEKSVLVMESAKHSCEFPVVMVDGVETQTYHTHIFAVAYGIPVNTWFLAMPAPHYID